MNNKKNLLRGGLLGCLLYASSFMLAQPITKVDASNFNQFLDEMELYFGDIMQISETQLSLFVSPFVAAGTSASCPEPIPVNDSMDDTQISFSWLEGSPGSVFRVGYLNLMTGANGTAVVSQNNFTFNVPNGLYAFVFQQNCGTIKSNATIIIYDKVVGLTADRNLSCKCTHTQIINDNVEGTQVTAFHEFDVWIESEIGDLVINQIHFKRSCSNCLAYDYNPDCAGSGLNVLNNVYYSQDEEDNNLATITLSGGLSMNLAPGITASLGICKAKNSPGQNGGPAIQVYPSGPQLYRLEKIAEPSSDQSQLVLFNQSGQVLRQWSFEGDTNESVQDIDLSPYPAGMYYLRIGTAQGVRVEKLIRS